jgi:hypothetical protein
MPKQAYVPITRVGYIHFNKSPQLSPLSEPDVGGQDMNTKLILRRG